MRDWRPYGALFMRHCLDDSPNNSLPNQGFEKVYSVRPGAGRRGAGAAVSRAGAISACRARRDGEHATLQGATRLVPC